MCLDACIEEEVLLYPCLSFFSFLFSGVVRWSSLFEGLVSIFLVCNF